METSDLKAKEAPDLQKQWKEWVSGSRPIEDTIEDKVFLTLLSVRGTKERPWGMEKRGNGIVGKRKSCNHGLKGRNKAQFGKKQDWDPYSGELGLFLKSF